MTNFPPFDEPNNEDTEIEDTEIDEPNNEDTEIEDTAAQALGVTASTTEPLDAIDLGVSDEQLLAAADASLHDEPEMVNATPGAESAGPVENDPNTGPAQPGAADPGAAYSGAGYSGASYANDGAGYSTPPGPPGTGYSQAPAARRLYRSLHDRRLGGVSAGIADYFRVDPTVVRLLTLVAAFTGIGILVYLAAWVIIPLRPEGFVEAPRVGPVVNERTMTLAFGVGALALAFGIATGSWAVLAIALIGGGVWLLSEHTTIAPAPTGAPPASATSQFQNPAGYEPTYVARPQVAPPFAPYSDFAAPTPPPATTPAAPVRERKPQRVTWTVLSLLALLAAIGFAAASGDWWDVSATRFLGIAVVIIGAGVVVGQVRNGGARGLIPLGILAALALFPVSAIDGLLDEGIGEAIYRPSNIAELETNYEHGIGKLTVDLSALDFEGRSDSIDIDLGIGELIVIVSDQTGGEAVLQARAGEVSHMLPSTSSVLFEEGVNIETGTVVLEGANGTLDLNIDVGLGTAELRSEAN